MMKSLGRRAPAAIFRPGGYHSSFVRETRRRRRAMARPCFGGHVDGRETPESFAACKSVSQTDRRTDAFRAAYLMPRSASAAVPAAAAQATDNDGAERGPPRRRWLERPTGLLTEARP